MKLFLSITAVVLIIMLFSPLEDEVGSTAAFVGVTIAIGLFVLTLKAYNKRNK